MGSALRIARQNSHDPWRLLGPSKAIVSQAISLHDLWDRPIDSAATASVAVGTQGHQAEGPLKSAIGPPDLQFPAARPVGQEQAAVPRIVRRSGRHRVVGTTAARIAMGEGLDVLTGLIRDRTWKLSHEALGASRRGVKGMAVQIRAGRRPR